MSSKSSILSTLVPSESGLVSLQNAYQNLSAAPCHPSLTGSLLGCRAGSLFDCHFQVVVNYQKSRTCSTDGVEFLGFIFRGYGGQIRVSPKKIKKFKDRIREITRRNRGVSMRARVIELRRYVQGWVGYFRLVPLKSFYEDLDKWIRRPLRACF